ncbi:hypothetical protein HMPREF0731_0368 [Pseudoroseomonas cervicalis ATCC 49957]|uniref:Uncharacterized protein n=1 Tax=Pseudoroseomonas cervicalis ATCC 49957 TaxID=525371 RepID=D5RH09_9PROT|nr:hypothetical protein HMPREF0731_0368 [Pseudoroseomonas cervicalis ATCC 49957]
MADLSRPREISAPPRRFPNPGRTLGWRAAPARPKREEQTSW